MLHLELELKVEGTLAIMAVAYLVYPLRNSLTAYTKRMTDFVIMQQWGKSRTLIGFGLALMVGFLYFLGLLTNALGYWVLEPTHNRLLLNTDAWVRDLSQPPKPPNLTELIRLPITRGSDDTAPMPYRNYLRDEVQWQNLNLEATKTLETMTKHLRVIRGTAISALAIAIIALLKAVATFLKLLLGLCRVICELLSSLVSSGLNQAATWSDCAASIPSLNFTPVMTLAK